MSNSSEHLRKMMVDVCHRLYDNGLVTATDGNVSARLENGNFLTTRTGINKGMVTADDVVEVDAAGKPLTPNIKPSTEFGMHLYIYSQRPDVHAIVHGHPTYATGFAVARQPLNACVFPEVIVGLGAIPLAEYATPSTDQVAASLSPFVKTSDAILLANHGVVTYGKDLYDAYFKMEKVEHAAHTTFVARMLGGAHALSAGQLEQLRAISKTAYGKDATRTPACEPEDTAAKSIPPDEEIRSMVRQMIHNS